MHCQWRTAPLTYTIGELTNPIWLGVASAAQEIAGSLIIGRLAHEESCRGHGTDYAISNITMFTELNPPNTAGAGADQKRNCRSREWFDASTRPRIVSWPQIPAEIFNKSQVAMALIHSVLGIPELLDLTIDQLATSKPTLHACAVVCKLWRRRAQYHLFQNITITGALCNESDADNEATARLADTFKISPHLAGHVRSLVLSLDLPVLALVAQMPLSNLREVTLYCTTSQRATRADRASIADVQRILRIPTVQTVSLGGGFPSIPVLNAYFTACSRSIVNLRGVQKRPFIELAGDDAIPQDGTVSENDPPKLPLIGLGTTETFGAWLHNPGCPFTFSALRMLLVDEAYYRTIAPAPLTPLVSLRLQQSPVDGANVDLAALTKLRRLTVFLPGALDLALSAIISALARIPPGNRLVLLAVRFHLLAPTDEPHVRRFDAELARLAEKTLCALKRVEFDLPLGDGVSGAAFEAWAPQAGRMGWLNVFGTERIWVNSARLPGEAFPDEGVRGLLGAPSRASAELVLVKDPERLRLKRDSVLTIQLEFGAQQLQA
ncbi:hypothetical protein B0H17DRAFT_1255995 [Mycena rosella]|uniref:Uncharacterized protein n=1 Tax=Mycena rosella TaxID=1033263 RepID=A0AAD7CUL4_MYCRO|nr:hypothetical protein B0H17DRAFT_1255995 [Mycena rosella]